MKKLIKKLFAFYKQDAELIFVFFGIKIKFNYPLINRLEEICMVPNLEELLERGTKFPHPIGIVINQGTKIGNNCTIWQNVTIGKRYPENGSSECPTIGNNVQIYANSVVLGGVIIGDNAKIGAGSVVISDVPDNSTVAGNPAIIIKK